VELRTLGRTGMRVSPLCLGAMMLGSWGNPDHDDCVRIVHAALDAGVNFVDTADVYSSGESEEILSKALSGGRRDSVVLATKFHAPMGADPNMAGNSRRWIMRAVEDSLRRLKTDWIDLYQVHRPDPTCDVDDTLGALSDLVHQGKVRAIGSSTYPAELIVEAQWTAERRGRERFECEQPPYSILARAAEQAVLPTCQRYGMGVIAWSPLNGGWLTGRYRRGEPIATDVGRPSRVPDRFDTRRPQVAAKLDALEALLPVAAQAGIPLAHLALAFVLTHPAVTSAIIGPRTMDQLTGLLGATDVALDDEVLDAIDAVVEPGRTIDPTDLGWTAPELAQPWRRRRPWAARGKGATARAPR
jgi:aryl-alcohol dehydrogenase-like predicted oxidoreductase